MMLADLEDLLNKIKDANNRHYMAESVRCYSAGSYRASVVIAVAAGMDDLRNKLQELATSGGSPQPVKDVSGEIETRFSNGDAFESVLIEACLNVAQMLTKAEADKLKLCLKTRHLCAHPSGHHGSAEEARDIITTMVNLVISRPAALGMSGVTMLLNRLERKNFFPREDDNSVSSAVSQELLSLHPTIMRALARRIADAIVEGTTAAKTAFFHLRTDRHKNCVSFMRGMLTADSAASSAAKKHLGELAELPEAANDLLRILSAAPSAIADLPSLVRDRCIAVARRNMKNSDPKILVHTWKRSGYLSAEHQADFDAMAESLFLDDINSTFDIVSRPAAEQAISRLILDSSENQWGPANKAIFAIQSMDESIANQLSVAQKSGYLLGVFRHAEGPSANHEASNLLRTGLGPRSDFIGHLINHLQTNPSEIAGISTEWDVLLRAVSASGHSARRVDFVPFLHTLRDSAPSARRALMALSTDPDTTLASAATAALL